MGFGLSRAKHATGAKKEILNRQFCLANLAREISEASMIELLDYN